MADIPGADLVKKPASWAKAAPLAFIVLLLLAVLLTVRFAKYIVPFLSKYRLTRWLTGLSAPAAPMS